MRAALAAHDEVLREAIEAHGGRVFKHTGDGVCAVFTSPRAAVEAAVAAQQTLELPVRMGIATGEAELRGSDYFGAVLNRAARVMAAGHGGQILLDGLTAGLLRGVDLADLGSRRLRDITDPVQVFQVPPRACAPSSRPCPPWMRRLGTCGSRPPADRTRLGGRRGSSGPEGPSGGDPDRSGWGRQDPPGPGGRRPPAEDHRDGVWVIELAPVGDPAAVPEAFAAVLGIIQQPGLSLADSLAAALEGRSRLLVVDNFGRQS